MAARPDAQPTSTSLCSNCGTELYYRRRFGGDRWAWVHAAIDAPAVQQCPGARPTPAGARWLLLGHSAAAVLLSLAVVAGALVR